MPAPNTGNYVIQGDGYRWGADKGVKLGAPVTITYSIPNQNVHGLTYNNISLATDTQVTAFKAALNYIASFTKINFVEAAANEGNLQIVNADLGDGIGGQAPNSSYGSGGYAFGVVAMNNREGYRLDDNAYIAGEISQDDIGGAAWQTLIHELAHTLGIKHPHDLNAAGDPKSVMPASMDNLTQSSMSYTAYGHSTVAYLGPTGGATNSLKPTTFGITDIAALQYLYGVNTSSKGNHTFAFKPDQPIYRTISDNGPNNTIDVSALKGTNRIDLTPGTFSDLAIKQAANEAHASGASAYDGTRALSIAFGVNVANVIGGSGTDKVTGNGIANSLYGKNGNDQLMGGGGNDALYGGNNADRLDGGSGLDYARYDDAKYGNLVISLAAPAKNTGAAKGDTYVNIEGVAGGLGKDTITGNGQANWLIGGGGKDVLTGGAGKDTFVFKLKTDSLVGGNRDVIKDFNHAQGDRIDLSAIDANSKTPKNDAFTFLSKEGAAFTKHAGELHFDKQGAGASAITLVEGDINGDGKADFSIQLTGHITLVGGAHGDFLF